MVSNSVK